MTSSPPKKKAKGPIRIEAVAPLGILVALVVVYFTLFFDLHMRLMLQWGLSKANGAEVNIAAFRTSFARGSLKISGIACTSPDAPTTNRLEIGEVAVRLNTDALLRAKWVIEEMGFRDILSGTARAKPGYVYPPSPPNPDSPMGKILARIQEEAAQSGLGQLSQLLKGFNPNEELKKLSNVSNLKSLKNIQELQTRLSAKQAEWTKALATVPGQAQIAAMQSKIAGIRVGGNPAEVQGQISSATSLVGETQGLVNDVKSKGAALTSDVVGFGKSISEVDQWIAADRRELESRLHLPQVDSKNLTHQLLGPKILGYVAQAQDLIQLARSKTAQSPGDKKSAKSERPPRRGVNYEFGRVNAYPGFWLKRADMTSTGGHSASGGDVTGLATDWTTNPKLVGKHSVADIQASFPKRGIEGVELGARLEQLKQPEVDRVKVVLGALPMGAISLSESSDLKLSIPSSRARARLNGEFSGENVLIAGDIGLRDATYSISAQGLMRELLTEATQGLAQVSIGVKITGTWDDLSVTLTSNLGDALSNAFKKRLEKQLNEVRAKIDKLIDEKVGKPKRELTDKYAAAQAQVQSQVLERTKQAEGLVGQAQAKVDQAKSQLQQRLVPAAVPKKFPF